MYKRAGWCNFDPTVRYNLWSEHCFVPVVPVKIVIKFKKMRLNLSVLIFFAIAYVATTENIEKKQIHNFLPYYHYSPNMVEHQRLFWRATTVAILKVSTLTYTISCTKSTTACSASTSSSSSSTTSSATSSSSSNTSGRQRREIDNIEIEDEDWSDEQLSIVPSNVQMIEATQVPGREEPAVNPQLLTRILPFKYYFPQEIQSGFNSDLTLALPYYGSFVQPAVVNQSPPLFRGFLNGLFPGFLVTKTEIITSITIAVTTSTLSPTCSTLGFLQCA